MTSPRSSRRRSLRFRTRIRSSLSPETTRYCSRMTLRNRALRWLSSIGATRDFGVSPNTRASISCGRHSRRGRAARQTLVGAPCVERRVALRRKEKRKLTEDGADYSADLSPSGELLVSRLGSGGTFSIWLQEPRRKREETDLRTPGHRAGVFSRRALLDLLRLRQEERDALLGTTGECHVLHKDEVFPMGPRFSPDGTQHCLCEWNGLPEGHDHFCGRRARAAIPGTASINALQSGRQRRRSGPSRSVPGVITGPNAMRSRVRRREDGWKYRPRTWPSARSSAARPLPSSPVFQPLRIEKDEISKLLVAM